MIPVTPFELWESQVEFFPDSIIISESEAARKWYRQEPDYGRQSIIARLLVCTMQYPVRIYYECGRNPDGTYKWRGCRYGVNGPDYVSGFSL